MTTVTTHKVTQPAMEFKNEGPKNLFYIKIDVNGLSHVINVGEKTYESVNKIIENGKQLKPDKVENKK